MGNLSELPIYIDDTPDMTVNEMRSKARRLQSEQGGKLGLVLIDYLQLMEGASPDNRVQELSKITRSLKGMARELNAPVMTLSQLSRGVESRMNKRPMMSDLRESGCLTGDTLITLADTGKRVPLQHLIGRTGFEVWAINPQTWKLEKATVTNSFCTGKKPVFRLTTQLGRKIRATSNHKFLTLEGWKRLDELKEQDYIALPRYLGSDAKIAEILDSSELQALAQSDVYWDKIASIEADGHEDVYDLTVSGLHNFVANDIIVHNSIEQDADLIIMLYRDEYYNPDSVDRGLAEVIITKHRNGPVGTVKLLFEPQFTRFRNLANSI
jgi:replicative DNA helicase